MSILGDTFYNTIDHYYVCRMQQLCCWTVIDLMNKYMATILPQPQCTYITITMFGLLYFKMVNNVYIIFDVCTYKYTTFFINYK